MQEEKDFGSFVPDESWQPSAVHFGPSDKPLEKLPDKDFALSPAEAAALPDYHGSLNDLGKLPERNAEIRTMYDDDRKVLAKVRESLKDEEASQFAAVRDLIAFTERAPVGVVTDASLKSDKGEKREAVPGQSFVDYFREFTRMRWRELDRHEDVRAYAVAVILGEAGELCSAATPVRPLSEASPLNDFRGTVVARTYEHLGAGKMALESRNLEMTQFLTEHGEFFRRAFHLTEEKDLFWDAKRWQGGSFGRHGVPLFRIQETGEVRADSRVVNTDSPVVRHAVERVNEATVPDAVLLKPVEQTLTQVVWEANNWIHDGRAWRQGQNPVALPKEKQNSAFHYRTLAGGVGVEFTANPDVVDPLNQEIIGLTRKLNAVWPLMVSRQEPVALMEVKAISNEEATEFVRQVRQSEDKTKLSAEVAPGITVSLKVREEVKYGQAYMSETPLPVILRLLADVSPKNVMAIKSLVEEALAAGERKGEAPVPFFVERMGVKRSTLFKMAEAVADQLDFNTIIEEGRAASQRRTAKK